MTVVNDGGSCSITNYIDVDARTRPDALRAVSRPQNGTLKISQPAMISYRPSPGFIGSDEFSYSGTGRTPAGRLVEMSVTVSVTVLPGPEPKP